MRVIVSHQGRQTHWGSGRYVIGRAAGCDIVLNDAPVSPRHAEVAVGGAVVLFDLLSATGVFVNGERVEKSRVLYGDERVRVGSQELYMQLRNEPSMSSELCAQAASRGNPTLVPPRDLSSHLPLTARTNALEAIGSIAEKAIACGRGQEAERMLSPRLTGILDDARAGHPISDGTRDIAIRQALALAAATGEGRWFDYAIELLDASRAPLRDETWAGLRNTLSRVRSVNVRVVRRYADSVRRLPLSIDRVRASHHLQELIVSASGRR